MTQRQERSDPGPHGIADDMRLFDIEMIQQRRRIVGHVLRPVGLGIVADRGSAMTAIVDRDDAIAGIGQRLHPARRNPVHLHIGGEPVNQQYRRSLARIVIGKAKAVIFEKAAHDPSEETRSGPNTTTDAGLASPRRTVPPARMPVQTSSTSTTPATARKAEAMRGET